MSGYQVRFQLAHGIHGNADYDQQRSAAEVEVDIHDHDEKVGYD
jgi:hypothetical protein